MARVAALVLAAGRGTRFGASDDDSKVVAKLAGQPMVCLVVEAALASAASPVVVVTGHAAHRVADALTELPIQIVWNANYKTGMAGSLQAGLAAMPADIDGVLVLLADMPLVEAGTLDVMVSSFDRTQETVDAMVPYFDGRPGNPVLIGRRLFADVLRLTGDRGARSLFGEPGRRILSVLVDDPTIHIDIDTLEMYVGLEGLP